MTGKILSAALAAALLTCPFGFTQEKKPSPTAARSKPSPKAEGTADRQVPETQDMQQAIAWERHKDAAAARQARIEAKHPTVTYEGANRSTEDTGRQVKDEKAPGAKRDKH